jgi:two-component system response regulator AtoC
LHSKSNPKSHTERSATEASVEGRILLIDNDPGVSQVVTVILQEHGYDVHAVDTAEAGLEALRGQDLRDPQRRQAEPYALVLLDLRMPGLGGVGFLDRVEALPCPPIIVLSGFISASDRERIDAHERVRAAMEKPFDLFELARIVDRLTGHPRAGAELRDAESERRDLGEGLSFECD